MFDINRKFTYTALASVSLLAGSLVLSAQSSTTTVTNSPGEHSRDTVVTGPNGKTATYQNNATWGNGAYNATKTYTGPNGKTTTEAVNRRNGQVKKTFTNANGHVRTYTHPTRGLRWRR